MKRNRMRTAMTVNVSGTEETKAAMGKIGKAAQERIFKEAVRPALNLIGQQAKSNAISIGTTGKYHAGVRRAIASRIYPRFQRMKGSRYYNRGVLAVWYGRSRREAAAMDAGQAVSRVPDWSLASLAHLFEFGYRLTHYYGRKIRPRRIPARPFMAPALEDKRAQAESMFRAVIRDLTKGT
jgi:hypothetical protein